jgi:hypothetical protein
MNKPGSGQLNPAHSSVREEGFQPSLFTDDDPKGDAEPKDIHGALDELFATARQYSSGREYMELMRFVRRFRFYSPFNAMLIHIQKPGTTFVAPPHRWRDKFKRDIRPGARPLIILQPMGPVMFVFDVSDTEPSESAEPLPREVLNPFSVDDGRIGGQLERTIESAKRDGIRITKQDAGAQRGGSIETTGAGKFLTITKKLKPVEQHVQVPLRYELLVNSKHSRETQYATIAHELGHLYCGHLGTPNPKWWPDRKSLSDDLCELEAESVSYLVCSRAGIRSPSAAYLAGYVRKHPRTPPISIDCVMKASGLIEQMGNGRMKPRKD